MSDSKPAGFLPESERPRYWDKRVSAAYLRMEGRTQEETATRVGRSVRTIANWEGHWSWPHARLEARERWYADVEDLSRRAVKESVQAGNAAMGLDLLERLDDRLAPAKRKHEVTGEGGGPLQVVVETVYDADEED